MAAVSLRGLTCRACLLGLLLVWASCTHLAGDAAREAAAEGAPVAVHESLRAVQTPESRQLISRFFASSQVHGAAKNVGQGFADGVAEALRGQLPSNVDAEKLGRQLSRGIVLGTDDALRELEVKEAQGKPTGLVAQLSTAAQTGIQLTTIGFVALGVLLLLLGIWVVRLMLHVRRDQVEARRHEVVMARLAQAIHATENKSWSPELRAELERQLRDSEAADYLHTLLHEDREARPVGH